VEDETGIRFSFHPATPETGPRHDEARAQHRALAYWIQDALPDCREKSLAMTALQESMMWCNAAIAYRGEIND
jgi:hypothetical protein